MTHDEVSVNMTVEEFEATRAYMRGMIAVADSLGGEPTLFIEGFRKLLARFDEHAAPAEAVARETAQRIIRDLAKDG